MRISAVAASNYSRLADFDLEVRGHMIIIGPNDVGKTSLLRLMNLTLGPTAALYQSLSVTDIRDSGSPLVCTVTLTDFDDRDRSIFTREIDIDPVDSTESLVIRLVVDSDPEDDQSILITRWCPGRGEERPLSREQLDRVGWRFLPALRQASAAQLDGSSGAMQALLQAVERDLGDERTNMADMITAFNHALTENSALTDLRKRMAAHLSSAMPRTISASDLAVRTSSEPDTSVLSNVSFYLSRDERLVPLSEQSDGMRQLMYMTLFDLAENTANMVAIDEPELYLHPASQRTVADLLSNASNQKIIVTHSPYVVQKFDPTQVVAVRADGTCNQIDTDRLSVEEKVQAHWWSPRILEALTARYAIVVEGVADRLVVEAVARCLGASLDRIGATIFELDGADKFTALYKLLGPTAFGIEVLGLVDDKEKGSWLNAFGGKPRDVLDHSVFVSNPDLEGEYCVGVGVETVVNALISSKVARDEQAILQGCGAAIRNEVTPDALAEFCRSNGGSSVGNRKVPAALALSKVLTKESAQKITSVAKLITELMRRAGVARGEQQGSTTETADA